MILPKNNFWCISLTFLTLLHLTSAYTSHGNTTFSALDLPSPCSKYSLELHQLGVHTYVCSEEGQMYCLPGWQGTRCQDPVCGPQCVLPRGVCHAPEKCFCGTGYYGEDCEHCIKRAGCVHGTCRHVDECICEDGWRGELCDEPECSQGCDPLHGYCELPHGDCQCYPGWTGGNCSSCQTLPGCVHGTCTKPMECRCPAGWTGIFCNIEICPLTCHPDNGECKGGQCDCFRGWRGETCEECIPYPGCLHGTCGQPWECNCSRGWGGLLCNMTKFLDDPRCPSGWTGPICTDCLKLPGCEHGSCEKPWECQCEEGWRGKYCSIPTCPRCHPINGFCIDADCMCRPGWKGEACDECITYTGCAHGTCTAPWECTCSRGWTGFFCNESTIDVLVVTQPVLITQTQPPLTESNAPLDTNISEMSTMDNPTPVTTVSAEIITDSSAPLTTIPTEVLTNPPTTLSSKSPESPTPQQTSSATISTSSTTTLKTTTTRILTKPVITENIESITTTPNLDESSPDDPYIPPDENISDFLDMLND